MHIAVTTSIFDLQSYAEKLAQQLNLPLVMPDLSLQYDNLLILSQAGLGLQSQHGQSLLTVDFLSKAMRYRSQQASLRHEMVAKALGLKNHAQPKIVDATAGLGRDSFIVASLGFEIQLIERSPIIHALLQDGLQRALQDPEMAPIVQRMHLVHADAIAWLKDHEAPDVIYLDPMFPERKKSALNKKEMRIFHDLVGAEQDDAVLFNLALAAARHRVVVKRPRLAPALAGRNPSFCLSGRSNRFDVYLNNSSQPKK